jgi:hypothetical protein
MVEAALCCDCVVFSPPTTKLGDGGRHAARLAANPVQFILMDPLRTGSNALMGSGDVAPIKA